MTELHKDLHSGFHMTINHFLPIIKRSQKYCRISICTVILVTFSVSSSIAGQPDGVKLKSESSNKKAELPKNLNYTDNQMSRSDNSPVARLRYPLGAGDLMKVTFYGRQDISGSYRVRVDGNLPIPMLGLFEVEGKDVGEVEKELMSALSRQTKRSTSVSIEVEERRPFYVVGFVNKPGAYSFVPGMTVLHAVALAGGLFRLAGGERSLVDTYRETNSLNKALNNMNRQRIRLVRLQAERNDLSVEQAAKELKKLLRGEVESEIADIEIRILKHRRAIASERYQSLDKQIALTNEEIESFEQQLEKIEEQINLNQLNLDRRETLQSKGLTSKTRVIELQLVISRLQEDTRSTTAAIARAKQKLVSLLREQKTQVLEERISLEREIREVEREISDLKQTVNSSRKIVQVLTGNVSSGSANLRRIPVTYSITHAKNNIQTSAKEATEIYPGDILRVNFSSDSSDVDASTRASLQ